ncbi:inner membrane protein YpjD [Verrucomicrobiota bacterium]
MTAKTILIVIGISVYGVSSVFAIVSLMSPRITNERLVHALTAVAAILITMVLILHGFKAGRIPVFGRFEALACYSLAVTISYLHLAKHHHLRGISAILLPYVTAMLIIGGKSLNENTISIADGGQNIWLALHILAAFTGYALFTLASILAAVYLMQDYNLKHKLFGNVFQKFPPLETLDGLMCRQIGFAFLMLSLSMAAGAVLVRLSGGGSEWLTDPKITATIATWIVYAILLHLRVHSDQHGKKIAIATILGLICVLFTFIGVHLITESVHNFISSGIVEGA